MKNRLKEELDIDISKNEIESLRTKIRSCIDKNPTNQNNEISDMIEYIESKGKNIFQQYNNSIEILEKEQWDIKYLSKVHAKFRSNFSKELLYLIFDVSNHIDSVKKQKKAQELSSKKRDDSSKHTQNTYTENNKDNRSKSTVSQKNICWKKIAYGFGSIAGLLAIVIGISQNEKKNEINQEVANKVNQIIQEQSGQDTVQNTSDIEDIVNGVLSQVEDDIDRSFIITAIVEKISSLNGASKDQIISEIINDIKNKAL